MKKISAVMVMGIFLLITTFKAQAQTNATWQTKSIESYHIAIAFSKTTNIVFPYSIVSVDIGSRDVLAQKAKGVENILQIKAAKDSFPQTNISIITADGKLTSFLVDYAEQPAVLNLSLTRVAKQNAIFISPESINQEQMENYASMAFESRQKMRGIKDKTFGIRLKLNGLFIHEDIMLMRFNIANETNINYDIDQLRMYIRDQKKSKRTAMQEIEILPVLVHNNTNKVIGQSDTTIVFVVPKFTIPDKKYLAIQLMEKNGGRHLELHVKNKKIVKAVPID
jgi:conjugative transposon TraN protein